MTLVSPRRRTGRPVIATSGCSGKEDLRMERLVSKAQSRAWRKIA
jgi:hypothetical protein